MSFTPYVMPERKTPKEAGIAEAEKSIARVKGELRALEKRIAHRSFGKNASLQEVRAAKDEHKLLTKRLKGYEADLEHWRNR